MEYKVLDNPANNAIDFKAFSTSDNANGAPHTVAIMPSKSAEKYFLDFESLSEGLKSEEFGNVCQNRCAQGFNRRKPVVD
tara:strand:+ start:6419 stop:6658 length:240 start_codon:yes stop_codon:yes gene_type:complete